MNTDTNTHSEHRQAVEDWLRVHRQLMDKEAAFNEVALRAASGEISVEELDAERGALMALRSRCTAVYEKAFPRNRSRKGGSPGSNQ